MTREVLEAGSQYSAIDYFKASDRLESLRPLCQAIFKPGRYARRADDADVANVGRRANRFGAWSGRLGYYTNFVNLLELSAIALPAGFTPDGFHTALR